MKQTFTTVLGVFAILLITADAHAFYNPGTGRWLNRDPIGESGGSNQYAAVRNVPVNGIDAMGLVGPVDPWPEYPLPPGYYPPTPPPPISPVAVPVGYDCCCCTAEKIAEGKKALMQLYNHASKILDDARASGRLVLDPLGRGPGAASCHDSNWAVLSYMRPTPPCWLCWMERRYPNQSTGMNENSIVCMSVVSRGGTCAGSNRIVFDYFDVAYHERDPDPPYVIQPGTPYEEYTSHYKNNDKDWFDQPVTYDDCSTTAKYRPGNEDYLQAIMK